MSKPKEFESFAHAKLALGCSKAERELVAGNIKIKPSKTLSREKVRRNDY